MTTTAAPALAPESTAYASHLLPGDYLPGYGTVVGVETTRHATVVRYRQSGPGTPVRSTGFQIGERLTVRRAYVIDTHRAAIVEALAYDGHTARSVPSVSGPDRLVVEVTGTERALIVIADVGACGLDLSGLHPRDDGAILAVSLRVCEDDGNRVVLTRPVSAYADDPADVTAELRRVVEHVATLARYGRML